MFTSRRFLIAAIAAVQLGCAGAVLAETGNIELELNTANDEGQGCRLTYVATNNTSVSHDLQVWVACLDITP